MTTETITTGDNTHVPANNEPALTAPNAPTEGAPETTKKDDVTNPFKGSKHKVKIDGNEMEVDYDDLVKNYQLSKVSMQKMNEAAKEKARATEIMNLFKQDPEIVARELGVNAVQWAEKIMAREAELALLTPEQREHRKLLDELKQLKSEKEEAQRLQEQKELESRTNYHAQQLDQQFTEALKTAGLPKTRATVQRMAQYMLQFTQAGHDVTPSDVVSYVLEDYQNEHKELWGASDLDQLYQQLGKDNVKKLIKMHNQEVSQKSAEKSVGNSAGTLGRGKNGKNAASRKPKKRFDDFFNELRNGSRIGRVK